MVDIDALLVFGELRPAVELFPREELRSRLQLNPGREPDKPARALPYPKPA